MAAQEAGFDVTCIEPDIDLAAYGRKAYGLTFLADTLENCSLDCERYDVITMFNLSNRSLDVLIRKLGLRLIHRELEWQIVAVDHIFRVLKVRAPAAVRFGVIAAPAISFPLILARK